ncbi:MAG TPA: DUF2254 domain-containing protein [Acidimicrobiales bacterium]
MTIEKVSARRPPHEPIRRLNFRERVAPSLWYTPGLFVLGSIVLSKLCVAVDRAIDAQEAPRWLLGADAPAAAALTSTVAAATLSFVAVVFTTTLVAIQLAGGQYSPRVVRVFVRSRLTHVTLGMFLATFVFALNALVEIRDDTIPFVPATTVSVVYLLLLGTLAAFITFVHGMSRILRVQYLLARVTDDGRRSFRNAFPVAGSLVEVNAPTALDGKVLVNRSRVGVIQAIDRERLVELARLRGIVLDVLVEAGEYIGMGTPVARVVGAPNEQLTADDVTAAFLLGAERTLLHDPGFVLRQLVDIAIRALSPAVNDPTTAVQVIDRVNDLLGDAADRPDPTGWYLDTYDVARVHLREPGFVRLLELAYVEIIRYGADSPQVVRRLRAAFDVLDPQVRPDVRPALDRLREMLAGATEAALPRPFGAVASVADRHGLG